MATHVTAPSQWLPGLDPDTAEFPDLFAAQNVPASCPSSPPPAEFPSTLATVESEVGGVAILLRRQLAQIRRRLRSHSPRSLVHAQGR